MTAPRISPLGDTSVTLTFGDGISPDMNDRVVREAARIADARLPGVRDVVPSYATLTVHYDPLRMSYADLLSQLTAIGPSSQRMDERATRSHTIPVTYNGEDLEDVARRTGLAVEEVIRIHSEGEYRVFVIGFVPGFAYLGPLDSRLVIPRRESPRKRVPPGSVAIAESQTGVYPAASPGGWHLIGTTTVKMFDASSQTPALLSAGDRVRFTPA
jgi:KipI family sensor histidine kinase inhibitor